MQGHLENIGEYFSSTIPTATHNSRRPPDSTVARRALFTPELLELIVLQATFCNALKFYALCRTTQAIIDASTALQVKLRFRHATVKAPDDNTFTPHVLHGAGIFVTQDSDKILVADSTVAVFGSGLHGCLPAIGTRWLKMQICQPPVAHMLMQSCCRCCKYRDQGMVSNVSGLTLQDLYFKASSIIESGCRCQNCYMLRHINTTAIFTGRVIGIEE